MVEAAEAAAWSHDVALLPLHHRGALPGGLAQAGDMGQIYYATASSVRRSGIPDWYTALSPAAAAPFATWACTRWTQSVADGMPPR